MSKPQIVRMSMDIAKGMCYLHQMRIIHRDLKSMNILIDNEGNILKYVFFFLGVNFFYWGVNIFPSKNCGVHFG